jgi:hypothetical protein
MKAFICSSLHLEAASQYTDKESPADAVLDTLSRIAGVLRDSGRDALFIAGGLFFDHRFSEELYNKIYNCLSALNGIHVFICPGPSDPYTPDSPYVLRDWPENVHIFKNRMKAFEIAPAAGSGESIVRVYGIGTSRHRPGICELNRDKLPKLDDKFLNVLVLPAPPVDNGGNIDIALLKKMQFDAYIISVPDSEAASAAADADNIIFVSAGLAGAVSGSISKTGVSEVGSVFPLEIYKYASGALDASMATDADRSVNIAECDPEAIRIYNSCERALEKSKVNKSADARTVTCAKRLLFDVLCGNDVPEVSGK